MPLLVTQRSSLGVVSDQLRQFEAPLNFTMSSFKTTPKNSLYRQLYGNEADESSTYDKQPEEQGNCEAHFNCMASNIIIYHQATLGEKIRLEYTCCLVRQADKHLRYKVCRKIFIISLV